MVSKTSDPDHEQILAAADRVARAAHIWIRAGNGIGDLGAATDSRQDIVAGVIIGLCDALQLDDRHTLLSAYAYALIDGEPGDALLVAQAMLRRRYDSRYRAEFDRGARIAVDLIALIQAPEHGQPFLPN